MQYPGPVDVSIVTKKIQKQHPTWKVQERRVNKFVRRHAKGDKNPAGADDDATAAIYGGGSGSKSGSSARGLFRMFSSRRKNAVQTVSEEQEQPAPAESAPPKPSAPPEPMVDEKETTPGSPATSLTKNAVESPGVTTPTTAVDDENVAYETDDNQVDSKADFCEACSIM